MYIMNNKLSTFFYINENQVNADQELESARLYARVSVGLYRYS